MSQMKDFEWLNRARGGGRIRNHLLRSRQLFPRRPRSYWYRGHSNFGDQLGPVIVEWITGELPIWVPRTFKGKLLTVGSILKGLATQDVVWGTGSIRHEPIHPPKGVRFLAVRGPWTRQLIEADVPEVYGDPALLIPQFHNPDVEKRVAVGVVPHYVDSSSVEISDPAVSVINVSAPWQTVVHQIRECEVIVSSSLHGLIVAEAYGIPASWIKVTDRVIGEGFKFNDYYLSTGRDTREPTDWRRGLTKAVAETASPIKFDSKPLLRAADLLESQADSKDV
jgi:pyruvyltransferase